MEIRTRNFFRLHYPRFHGYMDFVKVTSEIPHIRLRILMIDRGFEAVDLVRHTGISLSMLNKCMSGHRIPGPRTAVKIENFFNERIFSSPAQWCARRRKSLKRARNSERKS